MTDSPTTLALLVAVVFFAAFQQTLSGFGFALIVMPLLTIILGLRTAAPLAALAGLTLYTINLVRQHQHINLREVARLGAAAALGVPVGVWALVNVNEYIIKALLGVCLIAYALYRLTRATVMQLRSPYWVYLAGFLTGCLGGAYNTPGPPVVVYGAMRHWGKDEFRASLQALFFLTSALTVASHYLARNLTPTVLTFYSYTAPALVLGMLLAARVDLRMNVHRFRRIVHLMILALGLSLVLHL